MRNVLESRGQKTMIKYLVVGLVWAASTYYFTQDAFQEGFQQGWFEGQADAQQDEQAVFLQCTEWWFGGSETKAKQAINQYCDRRTP